MFVSHLDVNDGAGRPEVEDREAEGAEIDAELARACVTANMAAARQVDLIARALENGSYALAGIRSAEQWVAWQCGVSLSHARQLVSMARRGRRLTGSGRAATPEHLEVTATYSHPTGERLDPACVWFRSPPDSPPPRVVTEPLPTDVYRPRPTSFGVYTPAPAAAAGADGWGPDEELAYAE
jgi:hypothetical protein